MLPGTVDFSRTHVRQKLPLSTPPSVVVAGTFARPVVWNDLPRLVAATLTTPLLILTQKNVRLLIHALAILHARSIFASVTVRGIPGHRFCTRDRGLIDGLKLHSYLNVASTNGGWKSRCNRANHFSAYLVSDLNCHQIIRQARVAGCIVIDATDADIIGIQQRPEGYCVPMLDPQALARLLEELLIFPHSN